ncbi:TolC family protein [Prochlorococcus sp. MIT 1300]|uniref:TolC family protein n=1 Tax=Prochlorococcus sp. MIT 1300 TaxID=3096218 RepID=UPI002A747435|nr:TolC family protein [Prochlorococcus sp. MIT 1300]
MPRITAKNLFVVASILAQGIQSARAEEAIKPLPLPITDGQTATEKAQPKELTSLQEATEKEPAITKASETTPSARSNEKITPKTIHSTLEPSLSSKPSEAKTKTIKKPITSNLKPVEIKKTYLKLPNTKIKTFGNDLDVPTLPGDVKVKELRPLSLTQVEKLVEINNPRLQVLENQVEQAKSLLLAAISSWYPTVNLTANGLPQYLSSDQYRNPKFTAKTKLNPETGESEAIPFTKSSQWNAAFSVQVRWNLIDPARVPAIAAARDSYEKARDAYIVNLRELRLEAVSQYFLLQRADEGVRIGKQSMRASLVSMRDAKARYKAGVAAKLEVLQAETQLARDKQLLTRKLGDQRISRRALASLLNLPPSITPTAASPAEVIGIWQPSLQESIIAALNYREELDSLRLEVSIHNNNANAALAAAQPTLSIVNTFSSSRFKGQQGIGTNDSVDMDDYGWSASNTIGLSANWNIFDGGRAKALYRYNKQKAKESKANFAATTNNIRKAVEESFFQLQTANQDIETMTREVLASRESLRLARLRFQAGVTTQREVVNNQRDLTQAEVRYADAITTYNTSLAQLRRRTGLDEFKLCKSEKLPTEKPESNDLNSLPIEPFPVKPACQASVLNGEG